MWCTMRLPVAADQLYCCGMMFPDLPLIAELLNNLPFAVTYASLCYFFAGLHRLCRPGSIVGPQQQYLESIEARMFKEGAEYRIKHRLPNPAAAMASASADEVG